VNPASCRLWLPCVLSLAFLLPAAAQEPCLACHGPDGNSTTPGVPSIAGQPSTFLETQLVLIREELRPAPQMLPIVKGMSDTEIVELAAHFSRLPARRVEAARADEALIRIGMERAQSLRCGTCHLPDFSGQKQVPRLAGQREDYLLPELRAYRDNRRQGGDTIMAAALYGVPDADLQALAHFLSHTSP